MLEQYEDYYINKLPGYLLGDVAHVGGVRQRHLLVVGSGEGCFDLRLDSPHGIRPVWPLRQLKDVVEVFSK